MPQIVAVEEIETLTGRTFTDPQRAQAAMVLDRLEARLAEYLDRDLVVATGIVETVRPPRAFSAGRLFLARSPVTAVASVTVDGYSVASTDYVVRSWGLDRFAPVTFGDGLAPEPVIVVTYSAGLGADDRSTTVGRAVSGVLLGAAHRVVTQALDDVVGLESSEHEGYSTKWIDSGGLFHPSELAAVTRYRRRRSG